MQVSTIYIVEVSQHSTDASSGVMDQTQASIKVLTVAYAYACACLHTAVTCADTQIRVVGGDKAG